MRRDNYREEISTNFGRWKAQEEENKQRQIYTKAPAGKAPDENHLICPAGHLRHSVAGGSRQRSYCWIIPEKQISKYQHVATHNVKSPSGPHAPPKPWELPISFMEPVWKMIRQSKISRYLRKDSKMRKSSKQRQGWDGRQRIPETAQGPEDQFKKSSSANSQRRNLYPLWTRK